LARCSREAHECGSSSTDYHASLVALMSIGRGAFGG
jgi:hypothetical protein